MRHIIVGVDPGKTAAVACLEMNGRPLSIECARFVGFDWFVERIRFAGTPVIIASDKKNSTATIGRIAAAFGSRVYAPEQDISVKKKDESVRGTKTRNLHERDALAAALCAYNAYSNKFKQAEKLGREKGFLDIDELKARIVKKYSVHETITEKQMSRRA
ncbi:MAG: DUF460 domain-containing protein [Candidatus Micrarchaeota archaeon]|nr:DUF460 domain-containing protein [Candidatus Micrarchaeota archaeon]MDE1848139.1 DUF460 domain-containing protein [Candidatus Micrarchaeota archaeon]MDE1864794.1 DUF460 domain-containing protein [Candidatus Micrarchaeota archaeon]